MCSSNSKDFLLFKQQRLCDLQTAETLCSSNSKDFVFFKQKSFLVHQTVKTLCSSNGKDVAFCYAKVDMWQDTETCHKKKHVAGLGFVMALHPAKHLTVCNGVISSNRVPIVPPVRDYSGFRGRFPLQELNNRVDHQWKEVCYCSEYAWIAKTLKCSKIIRIAPTLTILGPFESS